MADTHDITCAIWNKRIYKNGGDIISIKEIISFISIVVIIRINYIINLDCLSYVKYNILTYASPIFISIFI